MAGRYYIKTFGCQMNEYDSARMADVLRSNVDLLPTDDPELADVLLMNTCSVREKAQEKVFSCWAVARARRRPASSSGSAAASRVRRARASLHARRSWTSCSVRRPCIACPK
jgi:tRNA A37 methylthiotransferase MiaB